MSVSQPQPAILSTPPQPPHPELIRAENHPREMAKCQPDRLSSCGENFGQILYARYWEEEGKNMYVPSRSREMCCHAHNLHTVGSYR